MSESAKTPWVMTVPVLSTEHLETTTVDDLHAKAAWAKDRLVYFEAPDGWFVFVGDDMGDKLPADLRLVFEWAQAKEHEWIRLNADGDVLDALPQYGAGDPIHNYLVVGVYTEDDFDRFAATVKAQSPEAAEAWMADAHEDVTVAAVIQLVEGEMRVVA